ncbi:hypothetical protein KY284_010744 [Solanum tuberosum]|nr:hypothetical protein KY284_010744 [Solanum tuberosum]
MAMMIDLQPGPHQIAYENLLTKVFQTFGVPLGEARLLNKKDMITKATLAECLCLPLDNLVPELAPHVTSHLSQLVVDLLVARDKNVVLQA